MLGMYALAGNRPDVCFGSFVCIDAGALLVLRSPRLADEGGLHSDRGWHLLFRFDGSAVRDLRYVRQTIGEPHLRFPVYIFTEGYRSGHNEAVLKTVCLHGRVGSNPTPSARAPIFGAFFYMRCF